MSATKVTTVRKKTNCGNCIAISATMEAGPSFEIRASNQFYYDSGKAGAVTLWEFVGEDAYVCMRSGARMSEVAADAGLVASMYGPLVRTTLTDVLVAHSAGLDARLRVVE
jgi:hypothetical protein